jgi:TATA-binding protein-associated factor Taf7
MARTTKIPCEGAIYTVRSDGYGTVVETDMDASAEAQSESDEPMREERARYALVLQELNEFEEAVAQAEARDLFVERLNVNEAEYVEEPDLWL